MLHYSHEASSVAYISSITKLKQNRYLKVNRFRCLGKWTKQQQQKLYVRSIDFYVVWMGLIFIPLCLSLFFSSFYLVWRLKPHMLDWSFTTQLNIFWGMLLWHVCNVYMQINWIIREYNVAMNMEFMQKNVRKMSVVTRKRHEKFTQPRDEIGLKDPLSRTFATFQSEDFFLNKNYIHIRILSISNEWTCIYFCFVHLYVSVRLFLLCFIRHFRSWMKWIHVHAFSSEMVLLLWFLFSISK